MNLNQVNVGIVGAGFVGTAHIEALRRIGVKVVGLADVSPEYAQEKAEAANLPRAYESVEALAADPDIDVVHITSPNHAHAEQVRTCLATGKHVVCEKPLGLAAAEGADLVERAAEAGVVNAVCFNIRFYPLNHQMASMVRSGEIGEPRFVTGSYLQDWLLLETDWNWRLVPDEAGGLRAVADIGSHWMDLARFVTGQRIVEVMAELHTFVPVRRHPAGPVETFAAASGDDDLIEEEMFSDDGAGILLRFEGGARGVLSISQTSAGRKNSISIEVDGSDSAMSWFSEDPDRLWIGHRGRANEILQRDPSLNAPDAARVTGYPGGHVEGYADTFRALFSQVYADVLAGRPSADPLYPTFADGHDALLVAEAVAKSSQEQRWVTVDR
ncbi:MAG: Gfo/Idh/MocA family oxidoreductase [Actinomycetota bacterium]|nr:Gfo/Idh/MocA family oxidoreductase [Actinomycetota bacterium]